MNIAHVLLAFISGIVIEALYAPGVIFIGERRGVTAGLLSVVWGVAFLVGVNESFKTSIAAALWCLGLGIGTLLGVRLKKNVKLASVTVNKAPAAKGERGTGQWHNAHVQRDSLGRLTPLAQALDAIIGTGCDCGNDEAGSCIACKCEKALHVQFDTLILAEMENLALRAELAELKERLY